MHPICGDFGQELWEAKATWLTETYTLVSIHPISISPACHASGPIRCPRCSPLPNPPWKHTNIYSEHTCTHINPAVIRGHNPSCLSGVQCKVASECVCVWKRWSSIIKREQHHVVHTKRERRWTLKGHCKIGETVDTQVRIREQVRDRKRERKRDWELQKSRRSLSLSHTQRFGPDQPER